jgi:protease-4
MSRRLGAVALGMACLGVPTPAAAGPDEGEARSLLRDGDRVYNIVAGEGDGASTVTNPANLGFLHGINGVVDFAWTDQAARRRGSAVGAFVGIPVPGELRGRALGLGFPWFMLGFGYQFFYPVQPDQGSASPAPQQPDEPFSKVTFALSVPLRRWVKGLSLGTNYSRLASASNFHADGVNQFDIGLGYWPSRFVALGLVFRGANVPRTGPDGIPGVGQSIVIDPEIAVRPLGRGTLELAGGVRLTPRPPADARWRVHFAEPRGRLFVRAGPARLFVEAERVRYFPAGGGQARDGAKLTGGIELLTPYVGIAGGVLTSAGGRGSFAADGGVARVRVSQERYSGLEVTPRRVTRLTLASYGGDRGMWTVIEELDRVAKRQGVALVETRGMSYGWAQIEELREAILRVRLSGGRVYVYMDGGTLRHYFLATAADTIVAHPSSGLGIVGMRIQTFYFADLLAKLGAKAEFVRIAEYKQVPESFHLDGPAEPTATQRKLLMGDVWNHVLRTVARDRGHDPRAVKRWIDGAPINPPRAVRDGVVDALAYPDELDKKLEQWLGHKVRIEKPRKQLQHDDLYGEVPQIAVVLVEGDLAASDSFEIPLLKRKVAGSYTLTRTIERLREDKNVKAIVLRCSSGGGDVGASDAIARELDVTRETKPVVVSMGNACGSGGYYVATGGQYIFAGATTLTGSIGIFYPKIDLSGTLEKFGISVYQHNYGNRAGLRSWVKPYTEDERAAAQQGIQDGYVVFTQRVGRARNMTLAQVDKVARGRVWSGVRGVDVGLVDRYGGLREAILRARAIAGLDPDEGKVVLYPDQPSAVENLRRLFNFELPSPLAKSRSGATGSGFASAASAWAIPTPLLQVLRLLPLGIFYADGPRPLAVAEETIVIAD